jgi:hypothetical protein
MLASNAGYWLQWLAGSAPVIAPTIAPTSSPSSPASWEQYVRAPNNQIIYPVSVIPSYTTGNVSNPNALLSAGSGVTTFTRATPPEPPRWPVGTMANESNFHAANTFKGQFRTYHPSNAIDGDVATFWYDDTPGSHPDILTVLAPCVMDLPGITILLNGEGVPVDMTVEVLQSDGSWVLAGAVKNNEAPRIQVPFVPTIRAHGVRVSVTQDQFSSPREITKINEVWPGLVDDPPLPPSVVVDFGKPVVGFLSISFAGASNNRPGMRLAFSEMTEYLTDISDFSRSYNVSQNIEAYLKSVGTLIYHRATVSRLDQTK